MNSLSQCMFILSLFVLSHSFQLIQAQARSQRYFVIHSEPDCSDYGQLDTVGEDFMNFPSFWENEPRNACFYIPELNEPNPFLWATFYYHRSPEHSECRLQWFYPSNQCDTGRFANTLVVTYEISVDAPNITCVPTYMTEEHADFNTTTLVYITITEPGDDESSTGSGIPQPEPEEKDHQSSGMSAIATCFVIGFSVVGVLSIAAACYVWRWRQLQTWERDNQQRLMSSRFGVSWFELPVIDELEIGHNVIVMLSAWLVIKTFAVLRFQIDCLIFVDLIYVFLTSCEKCALWLSCTCIIATDWHVFVRHQSCHCLILL